MPFLFGIISTLEPRFESTRVASFNILHIWKGHNFVLVWMDRLQPSSHLSQRCVELLRWSMVRVVSSAYFGRQEDWCETFFYGQRGLLVTAIAFHSIYALNSCPIIPNLTRSNFELLRQYNAVSNNWMFLKFCRSLFYLFCKTWCFCWLRHVYQVGIEPRLPYLFECSSFSFTKARLINCCQLMIRIKLPSCFPVIILVAKPKTLRSTYMQINAVLVRGATMYWTEPCHSLKCMH